MTRKMIIVLAIGLIAAAPTAIASPLEEPADGFQRWIEVLVEAVTNLLDNAENAGGQSPTPPEAEGGDDELGLVIVPGG